MFPESYALTRYETESAVSISPIRVTSMFCLKTMNFSKEGPSLSAFYLEIADSYYTCTYMIIH